MTIKKAAWKYALNGVGFMDGLDVDLEGHNGFIAGAEYMLAEVLRELRSEEAKQRFHNYIAIEPEVMADWLSKRFDEKE